jgi:hypothetical protein
MTNRELVVDAGQVTCPESGQVDLERCLTCPRFRRMLGGDDGATLCVECRPPRTALSATWDDYSSLAGHLPG